MAIKDAEKSDSLLDPIEDEDVIIDERFVSRDEDGKLLYDPDGSYSGYELEILSDQFDDDVDTESGEVLVMDDGDTFALTREDDPMYEIYPITMRRPTDLFKHPLYDRQSGETRDSYQRFLVFSALPPAKRTVASAWREWQKQNGGNENTPPSGQFRNLSNHWRWAERAYALDIQKTKVAQQIWIERDLARREADYQVGNELREKAFSGLDNLSGEDLGPNAIAKFFSLASDLQKDSIPDSGLSTDELNSMLDGLPKDRRDKVIEIVIAKAKLRQ